MYREDKIKDITYKFDKKTGEVLYTDTKRKYLRSKAVSIRDCLPGLEYNLEGINTPKVKGTVFKDSDTYTLKSSLRSDLVFRLIRYFPDRSVVVMQVLSSGTDEFRLMSKDQCEELGIMYQNNLAIFSSNLDWTNTNLEDNSFDPTDLKTYDRSIIPGKTDSIRYIVVEVSGLCHADSDTVCYNRYGIPTLYIDIELLLTQLEVKLRRDIFSINPNKYCELSRDTYISWSLVRESISGSIKRNSTDILDQNEKFYLILDFTNKGLGIFPDSLEGVSVDDLVNISINTSFYTSPDEKPSYKRLENLIGFTTVAPEIFTKKGDRYWKKGITGSDRFLTNDK